MGSEVHAKIEWTFKEELDPTRERWKDRPNEPPKLTSKQAERSFERWLEWRAQVKLKVIDIEKRVYSSLFGFGGTLDLLAEITVPSEASADLQNPFLVTRLAVMDYKTGKAVYAESYLQNVAYRLALKEEGIATQAGWIIRLPKYEEDPVFDAVRVPDDEDLAVTFLALGIVYRWFEKSHKPKGKPTSPSPHNVVAPKVEEG